MTDQEYVEIPITKGNIIRKETTGKCSQQYFEITLPNSTPDNFVLTFQNFYTAAISIVQDSAISGSRTLLDAYQLMAIATAENDAQNWHKIPSSEFKSKCVVSKPLRVFLFQPAGCFIKFELRNVRVLCINPAKSSNATPKPVNKLMNEITLCENLLDDWKLLTEAAVTQSKMKGLVDLLAISNSEGRRQIKRKERKKEKRNTIA